MKIDLDVDRYELQCYDWPDEGNHILAQYDDDSIVVYQAYGPEIGRYVVENGRFGGKFSLDRMTWIKSNFLWMMYRSGWGQKKGQEFVFAIRLKRRFFDKVLRSAVSSIYEESSFKNKGEWKNSLGKSSVRVQWDPDRDPSGAGVQRRAIQLGLKGKIVKEYVDDGILEIENVSEFVSSQYKRVRHLDYGGLITPKEEVYLPSDDLCRWVNISRY